MHFITLRRNISPYAFMGFILLYFGTFSDSFSQVQGFELTDPQKRELEDKAKGIVMDLWDYIGIISDKSQGRDNKLKAIELAVGLFSSEDNIVEVSGKNGIATPKIRVYLERLRMLPYEKVSITALDFAIISSLRQDTDGKLYVTVVTQQNFKAYQDGRMIINDIDFKRTQIVIDSVPRADGQGLEFIVKIGDIKVDIGESSLVRY